MRVVVAAPQVPFVHGGAELRAEDLVAALRRKGHQARVLEVLRTDPDDHTAAATAGHCLD